ncbi:MAG: hypothetical protein IKC17_05485 [Bacteroidales bacterium]|nr:hypothetical protein [Bacteroidales bacterium]
MRKYFLSFVALAAGLFATSCQESIVEPQVAGPTTFTVQLPDAMGTKAEIGSANTVNQLFVSVYAPGCSSEPLSSAVVEKTEGDGTFTVQFNLIQDQTYDLIFWAQTTDAYVDKSLNENARYDLRKIDISERFYSSENGAAFYAYQTYVIDGQPKEATLRRPFAQLNIGTTVESLKTDADSDIILEGAKIEVKNVASSFNTVTGFGEGDGTTIYGQPLNFVKVVGEDIQVNSNQKYAKLEVGGKSYVYVTMDYLPIISSETVPKDLVEIKLIIDTDQPTAIEHTFSSVPVQRNYRTNIVGNLISSTTDFIVEVNDDWAGADNNIVKTEVSNATELQAAIENTVGGEIVLTDDIVLTQTLEFGSASTKSGATAETEFILDLNGKTIDAPLAENSETNHIYALENNSKLTIKGNGTINARGIFNYGGLTLENGTINAIDGNGGYAIRNYPGSTFTMNGGTIATTLEDDNKVDKGGYDATTLRVDEGASAVINGGTINNICDYTYALDNYGEVIINAGTFTSVHSTVSSYGNLTINGGSFTCNGIEKITAHALVAWDGSETTINGGSFDGKDNYNGFNVDAAAGSSVIIKGGEFLPVHSGSLYGEGEITVSGGTFFDDPSERLAEGYASVQNEDGTWGVCEAKVVIGEKGYSSLQAAIDAVKEGETITLLDDITITEPAYGQNALNYTKGVNCVIDLNEKTLSANTGNSVFRFNTSQIEFDKDVIVTLKNGTVISGKDTWCALMAAGKSETAKAIFNLEDLIVNGSKAGDLLVKAWDNSLINAKKVTINAINCAGGFYAVGGEMVLDNCRVNQEGLHTAPYLSMAIAVSNGGKITVNSGNYIAEPTSSSEGNNQGTTHGSWCAGVMNSGGTLIINGGTFNNGNYGDDNLANAARGLIFGDTKSEIIIYDGVFNALKTIVDYQNNLGVQPNPNIVIYGGDFSANPSVVTSYGGVVFAEGKVPVEGENGRWTVEEVCDAVIGNQRYATLQEAFNNVSDGETIVLQRDITLSETANLAEGKTAVLDLNGKTLGAADMNVIKNDGGNLTIKNGTVTRTGEVVGYSVNNASGEIVIENATIQRGLYTSGSKMTATNANISHEQSSRHAIYAWNCEVTINSGTFHNNNAGNATLFADGSSVVTIKGGTFSIADGRSSLGWTSPMIDQKGNVQIVVEGGLFNGGFRTNSANTQLTIKGGEFNTNNESNFVDYSGTRVVMGGKFTDAGAQNWAKKYIADDYEMNEFGEVVMK